MLQFFGFKKDSERKSKSLIAAKAAASRVAEKPQSNQNEIRFPTSVNIPLFIGSPNCYDINIPQEQERLLQIIARSKFSDLAATALEPSWLALIPTDWVIPPLEPFFEYLPISQKHIDMLRQLRWIIAIRCAEKFDSELRGYQLLNFLATEIALHHDAVCLDGSTGRVYTHADRAFVLYSGSSNANVYTASRTPSLRPFLSVTATRYGDRVWMTGHGLNRFMLPEFEIENVEPELVDPTVYLMNGLAQALIERVIGARTQDQTCVSLDEPFIIGTDMIVAGNRGDLPFSACIPTTESLRLKLVARDGGRRLSPDYDSPAATNAELRRILQNLSLLKT